MDLGLRDRPALVLGSSSGIGYACAEELAAEGCRLVLVSRSRSRLQSAKESICANTGAQEDRLVLCAGDVSREDDIERIVRESQSAWGKIDILVTNAGGPPPGTLAELSPSDFEAGFRLNLMSAIRLTQAVVPRMVEQSWGRIVHLTSVAIRQPIAGLAVSNTIRSAFLGYTRTFAGEYARHNVTMHNVCPGYTVTERLTHLEEHVARSKGIAPDKVRAAWESQIPARRLGEAREIAALVAFLCSERSSYMTGCSIAVDGGFAQGIP